MGFVGVYKAIYDYAPQAEGELAIADGDLLFILEKGDDGWWKAKKAAQSDGEDEPVGDIPNNYVEEVSLLSISFASDGLLPPKTPFSKPYIHTRPWKLTASV